MPLPEWFLENRKWIRVLAAVLALALAVTLATPGLSPFFAEGRAKRTAEYHMEKLDAALEREDYPDALKHLEEARRRTPPEETETLSELYLRSASVYVLLEQGEEAEAALDEALALHKENVRALLLRAQLAINADEGEKAAADLEAYMALMPQDSETGAALGQLYEGMGQYARAREQYQRMAAQGGSDSAAQQLNAWRCSFLDGDYAGAAAGFEDFLLHNPDEASDYRAIAHFLLAACRMQLDRPAEAAEGFRAALEAGYDAAACREQIVLCSFDAGDYPAVVEAGQALLRSGKKPAAAGEFYQRLGAACMQTGLYEPAAEYLSLSLEAAPQLAATLYYRGVCFQSMERYEEAAADYTGSLEGGFLPQYCYYNRGICRIRLEDYRGARSDMESTLTAGEDAELIREAESILEQLDKLPEAEETENTH